MARRDGAGEAVSHERVVGFVVSDFMVLLLIAASVAGVVFDRPALTALGTLVLLLALVGRVWARHALEHVDYRCEASTSRALEGDCFTLTLILENRKSAPVPWLRIREQVPHGLELIDDTSADAGTDASSAGAGAAGGSLLLTTTALGPRQRVRLSFRLRARRRGRYVLGPGRLASGDPFGFYESERVVTRTASTLLVLPAMPLLPRVPMRFTQLLGERARRAVGPDDPMMPLAMREYRSGDALRTVDWKASARRAALQVRINEVSVNASVLLLLECDTRVTGMWDTSPARVDVLVRVAAGLARDLLAAGYAVGLLANGVPPGDQAHIALAPATGRDQLARLLDALARVQPVVVRPLSELLGAHAGRLLRRGTGLVCIAAVLQADTRALLRARARAGTPALLIQVSASPERAPPGVLAQDLDPALAEEPVLDAAPAAEAAA